MNIIWDEEKNDRLKAERGISFEEVAELIVQKKYVGIVRNSNRPPQRVFLVPIHGYIHAVPFVIDDESNVVLKTVFPSRKLNKKYGEKQNENKT